MSAPAVRAIRAAFEAGIPGDRRGPGRTIIEIYEAAGVGDTGAVIEAIRRLQALGEVDGGQFSDGLQATTLYWRRADVLFHPLTRARWLRGAAATQTLPAVTPRPQGGQLCLAL